MCDELGKDSYMTEYVTEYGMTSACEVATGEACTERELDFIGKWKGKPADEIAAQITRLRGMGASSMKADLKQWLGMRVNALSQLHADAVEVPKEEL